MTPDRGKNCFLAKNGPRARAAFVAGLSNRSRRHQQGLSERGQLGMFYTRAGEEE